MAVPLYEGKGHCASAATLWGEALYVCCHFMGGGTICLLPLYGGRYIMFQYSPPLHQ